MTKSLRWLAWPTPRRDGIVVIYAHAFIVEDDASLHEAVCKAPMRLVGLSIINPREPHDKCPACDARLRELGGPHPAVEKLNLGAEWYDPRYTFEDWVAGGV